MHEIESNSPVNYLRLFTRKLHIILLIVLITTLASTGFSHYRVPLHTATATLIVAFNDPLNTSSMNSALPAMLQDEYMGTQIGIISSRFMAERVLDNLDFKDKQALSYIYKRFDKYNKNPKLMRKALSDWMLARLRVYVHNKRTRLIKIAFTSERPSSSVLIANAFAQEYIKTTLELNLAPIRSSAKWARENIKPIRESLYRAEKMLTENPSNKVVDKIDNLLDGARRDLSTLISILDQDFSTSEVKRDNQYIFRVRSEILENEQRLIEKSRTLGERDEEYKALKIEANYLKKVFLAEVEKQIEAMRVAMDSLNQSLEYRGNINQSNVSILNLANYDVSSDAVSLKKAAIYGAILGFMLGILVAFFSLLNSTKL